MKTYSEQSVNLPDGHYKGLWSGYKLTIFPNDRSYEIYISTGNFVNVRIVETNIGVKGIDCKVTVVIEHNKIVNITTGLEEDTLSPDNMPSEEEVLNTIFDCVSIRGIDLKEYTYEFSDDHSGLYSALCELFKNKMK
jgi:hypothetical protein